jgi:predicted phosphoribosyltransferase
MSARFRDRADAGHQLARALCKRTLAPSAIVLGLPRGGVPVAHAIAIDLRRPLDVLVVRKVGAPGQPELAMGAVASGGARVLNHDVLAHFADSERLFAAAAELEMIEVARREALFRGGRAPLAVEGRTCIVVDDGLATGATMEAAVLALRALGAGRIVVAVPVAAHEAVERISRSAEEIVCLQQPMWFRAVGVWYDDFEQTRDDEVARLLADPAVQPGSGSASC